MNKTLFKFNLSSGKGIIVINKSMITYLHQHGTSECDIHLGKDSAFKVAHTLEQVLSILGENGQEFKPSVA